MSTHHDRILKISRVPLDHIFATAARVYRRFHLRPALSSWHAAAVQETHRINRRNDAAICIQNLVRMFLARRVTGRHRRTRGTGAVEASKVIQSGFRAQKTREVAAERGICRKKQEKIGKPQRQNDTAQAQRERREASVVIQASWRAAVGRGKGAERARQKLRAVLVGLGGGLGRMHRYVDPKT